MYSACLSPYTASRLPTRPLSWSPGLLKGVLYGRNLCEPTKIARQSVCLSCRAIAEELQLSESVRPAGSKLGGHFCVGVKLGACSMYSGPVTNSTAGDAARRLTFRTLSACLAGLQGAQDGRGR